MNKLRQVLSFIFPMFTLLISSCGSGTLTQIHPMECIKSFQEFAYSGPELKPKTDPVLPSSPWEIETMVPIQQINGYFVSSVDIEITRSTDLQSEIWIAENLFATESSYGNKNIFVVYQSEQQKWTTVSADIGNTGLFVRDLFVKADGSVWGRIIWDVINVRPTLKKVPVLSKFNEHTQRFEFAEGVLEIPWRQDDFTYFPWPEIVLDNNGIFWIFAKNDGIYRYDPTTQRTEKQTDLSNLNVTQATLSPDGSIYFVVFNEKIYSKESFFQLLDGMLFQFIPKTREVVPLKIPSEPWPIFSGILVDNIGRLWLGAIGYRERNGDWQLIHPDPEQYFTSAGDAYMMPPALILESSDKVLWYKKFLDDVRADGTAWYDPRTGEGCMFTNKAVDIVEDSEQQLWLVAENRLFKYKLNP